MKSFCIVSLLIISCSFHLVKTDPPFRPIEPPRRPSNPPERYNPQKPDHLPWVPAPPRRPPEKNRSIL